MCEPKPASGLIFQTAIWYYDRGLAQVRKGDLAGARESLAELASIAEDPDMGATRIWEVNTMAEILGIARDLLGGEAGGAGTESAHSGEGSGRPGRKAAIRAPAGAGSGGREVPLVESADLLGIVPQDAGPA